MREKKKAFLTISTSVFILLVGFLSHFFFYDYPMTKAATYVNSQHILRNEAKCNELREDVRSDIIEIKETQKEILSILLRR